MAETKIPAIYRVPSSLDPELKRYLESVQEAVEVRLGRRGDELDQAVTYRDLIDSNLAQKASRLNRVIEPIIEEPTPSMPFNTVPQNVKASGAFTKILVTWDDHQMGSLFARAEIWRSGINDLNTAGDSPVASVYGSVWTDTVDYNTTMYYWVRFVQRATSVSGNETYGAFSDPAASATTAANIGTVMTELSEQITNLPGYSTLNTTLTAKTEIIKADSEPSTRAGGSALQAGDIWVDTNDNNQQYVRNAANNAWVKARDASLVTLVGATSFTGSNLTAAMATAQSNISTLTTTTSSHTTSISSLNTSVAVKRAVYRSDNEPSGGTYSAGDLWVDTNDNNKMYQYTGSAWTSARDTFLATSNDISTVNASIALKAKVFRQDDAPTSGMVTADLWVDTNDNNQLYQYNGSSWVTARDQALATATQLNTVSATATSAQNTANSKIQVFRQDGIPTSITAGDIWIDTNDNNKMYIAAAAGADQITAGEWVESGDSRIASSAASVTSLSTAVTNLQGDADASYVLQVNANGAVAGMVIESSAQGASTLTSIAFQADQFSIWDGSGATSDSGNRTAPFIVSSGTVYIDSAMIQNAAITNAKIADATIETAKIVTLNADKIRSGTIEASTVLKIGSSGSGATDQRIEITAASNRILVVDDSS